MEHAVLYHGMYGLVDPLSSHVPPSIGRFDTTSPDTHRAHVTPERNDLLWSTSLCTPSSIPCVHPWRIPSWIGETQIGMGVLSLCMGKSRGLLSELAVIRWTSVTCSIHLDKLAIEHTSAYTHAAELIHDKQFIASISVGVGLYGHICPWIQPYSRRNPLFLGSPKGGYIDIGLVGACACVSCTHHSCFGRHILCIDSFLYFYL